MKNLKYLVITIILSACSNRDNKFIIDDNYKTEINTFLNKKLKERQEDYLQLIALYRLEEGMSSFGKDEINNLKEDIDKCTKMEIFYPKTYIITFEEYSDLKPLLNGKLSITRAK